MDNTRKKRFLNLAWILCLPILVVASLSFGYISHKKGFFVISPTLASLCGNNIIESDNLETCDDGGTTGGDGCSDNCVEECNSDADCTAGRVGSCYFLGSWMENYYSGICSPYSPKKICELEAIMDCTSEEGNCDDGIDNDGDTDVDCDDSDCSGDPSCSGGNPTVSTYSPTDDATDVAVDANLVLTFSENVYPEAGANNDIVIKKVSDDSVVETIDAQSGQVTGGGTPTITINPSSDLLNSTAYYIQIGADAFDDADSNSYAGISDTTTWNFTTVAAGAPSTDCDNDGTDDGANEDCSNCPNDAYSCSSTEKCINGSCVAGTCAREDVCGDGWVGPNEDCDDGGICKGSSNAAYNNQDCGDIDPSGNITAGAARCRATGGWCQAQDGDGCPWDCQNECKPDGAPCVGGSECCGTSSCVDGVCAPDSACTTPSPSGPNSASVQELDMSIGDTDNWVNRNYVLIEDDQRARFSSVGKSYLLKVTNFGFSIPTGSTIAGITAEIKRGTVQPEAIVKDNALRIIKNGSISTTDRSNPSNWTTIYGYYSYGGSSDTWGETWTATDINSTNFGIALSVDVQNLGSMGYGGEIDHIRITVHYCAP